MKTLCALGIVAGGFLFHLPPRVVLVALTVLVAYAHPFLASLSVLTLCAVWRHCDD